MGWVHFSGVATDLRILLADGYLPPKGTLERLAAASTMEFEPGRYGISPVPRDWQGHDEDSVYEKLAYNIRQAYCACRPPERRVSAWSEAWLLRPAGKWSPEYKLKKPRLQEPSRRLLVSLYEGCDYGQRCVQNLVTRSHFQVIPNQEYGDFKAFWQKAEDLLAKVATPFRAPCMVAEEKMTKNGYEYRAFGR